MRLALLYVYAHTYLCTFLESSLIAEASVYMFRSRIDITWLNIATSKIEFGRDYIILIRLCILGTRDVSLDCKGTVPFIQRL